MDRYSNPLQLPEIVLLARLTELDPYATCRTFHSDVRDILSDPTVIIEVQYYVDIETDLDESAIQTILSTPLSSQDTNALNAFTQALPNFKALPNWATWSADEASNYITANVLNGWQQAQVDNYIDTNVTSLAGARTALKQIAAAIISIRTIMTMMAKAIMFLRDYALHYRK